MTAWPKLKKLFGSGSASDAATNGYRETQTRSLSNALRAKARTGTSQDSET